ncbi:MAG: exodeoxyribonuclease III [Planctomycetota bacterium]|jgi:exodeoxyribonuclease III|nr:exodeoxyribonuclease III [Planctomycetota bacterium]
MSAARRRQDASKTRSLFGTDERAFTLCSLNCNGIRSAASKGWAQWLAKGRPDVLCLQEVRAWPEQVDASLRCPEGYNSRWLNAEKKGYSGVATYSRPAADRYVEGSGLDWSDAEGRVLRTDLPEMTILNVYVPSGSSSEERQGRKYLWLDHFLAMTADLLSQGRPTVICGDFNIAHTEIDIHAPKRNEKNSGFLPEERAWFSRLLNQGWADVLRDLHPDEPGLYSWWSNRGRARENDLGWRLDYVLASPDLAPCAREAWIEKKAGLSDHAPVWVRFAL